jgi:2-hydroxy-6-oxonona-2,4-dienedioate hydrolase
VHAEEERRPADVIAALDRSAARFGTPCGSGEMVWRRWGRGQPVVLLHGGSGSWTHWLRVIPALAGRAEVWAADLPGLGDSAMPPAPLVPETCGQVVAAGIRQLIPAEAGAHLVGFSFGGHAGTFAAAELGSHIASFTLSGSAALGLPHPHLDYAKERSTMTEAERAEVYRDNLAQLMFADPARIDALAIHIQAENVAKSRFRSRRFAATDEIRRTLPRVRVPVQAIWGADDQIALPSVEARYAAIRESHPELRTVTIANAGHWAAYEQPEAFVAALTGLLGL